MTHCRNCHHDASKLPDYMFFSPTLMSSSWLFFGMDDSTWCKTSLTLRCIIFSFLPQPFAFWLLMVSIRYVLHSKDAYR